MSPQPTLQSLRSLYSSASQSHLFTFFSTLSPADQTSLLAQLASIDVHRVNRIFQLALASERALASSATAEEIQPLPTSASLSAPAPNTPEEHALSALGLEAIGNGEVAVLLMAGGQGTRLGSPLPKGMFDIKLPSGKCLFELQAQRILKLQERAGKGGRKIPWFVMTSGPTRMETERFFEEKGYFGLEKEDVIFFDQGVLPALSNDGKIFLSTPSTVSVAPDGNGGLYSALRQSLSPTSSTTVLSSMRSRGIKYIHAYGVDNCLVKVADPVFLGFCIQRGAEVGAKVVKKEKPEESVGVVAMRGGKFGVVEYSELSKEKSEERDQNGELAYRAANIVNHFYTLEFLESVEAMEDKMAFHIARKKIPTVDLTTGEPVKPTSPNGLKLELFVFDVFPFTPSLSVFEVPRSSEFSPLKNGAGTTTDNAETSRRDLLALQRRWLEAAGCEVGEGVEVELAPGVSYAGEGLEALKGRKVIKGGAVETMEELEALCA